MMGQFLSYSFISGLLMLAMFLAYRLFLARDCQHAFNRCILLLIYTVSFLAIPILTILKSFITQTPQVSVAIGEIEIRDVVVLPASSPIWGSILIWIFIAGMIITTIKTVITWVRLIDVIRSGERIKKQGYSVIVTDNNHLAPFSWMKYIVVSRTDYNDNYSIIEAHELKHVASYHWIDLMIAQIVCVINWFNPVAWLMRDELMMVHEYQADMAVLDSGFDLQQYQMLLIKKAVGARFPSLANSLNHSVLKKRITMMYKDKSGARQKFKALTLIPMLALALVIAHVPVVSAAIATISSSDVSVSINGEKSQAEKKTDPVFQVTNINNQDDSLIKPKEAIEMPDVMPQYPGGESAIMNAIMSKVSFPMPDNRWKTDAGGLTTVEFTVMPDGTIGNLNLKHSCGYDDLDQMAIDAVKNGLTEKWTPGSSGGKPVAVSYCVPIRFKT